MKLVIAEKPSVAQAIAKALGVTERKDGYLQGDGYIISWCVGHLVGLADAAAYDEKYGKWRQEDLPILPEQWKLIIGADKAKQFKILKTLMHSKDVSSLVCATDAGREGELIFRFVYEQAGCTKPFERLWISSMEDAAIRSGFASLKDGGEYDNLYASALCRAKADWLVGINATRLFTTIYNHKLNVGRVQSPTLAMLVERDGQIKGFQKEKYYHARIGCDGFEAASDRIKDKAEAAQMRDACNGNQAVVVSVNKEHKTVNPPKLYDLTSLQREANRLYGYTAQQTLDLVQSLYEKKLCTYPRTDSQFLTSDMEDTARRVVDIVFAKMDFAADTDFKPDIGRVINNAKVTDHNAVIPTIELEKTDLAALPETERKILSLVAFKLLCAVAEQHIFEAVTATLECGGHSFTAKGKSVLAGGWKAIEHRFKRMAKTEKEDAEEEATLPPLADGQTFEGVAAFVTEHTTTPPKAYTEDIQYKGGYRKPPTIQAQPAHSWQIGAVSREGVINGVMKGRNLIPPLFRKYKELAAASHSEKFTAAATHNARERCKDSIARFSPSYNARCGTNSERTDIMEKDHIRDAFARMNLQQTISFLLFGTDEFTEETHPYRETLKTSSDPICKRLESIYPDGIELDKAAADLSLALSACESVYMEIGMKAGARLVHQLLCVDDQGQLPTVTPILKIK